MNRKSGLTYAVFGLMSLMLLSCNKIQDYDVVLLNGEIYNVEKARFEKLNIGIKNGLIDTLTNAQLSGITTLDCEGKYVYPGFIDAHCHFKGYATGLSNVNLVGTTSYLEVIDRIKTFLNNNENVNFVVGRGWDQNDWQQKSLPSNELLNQYFPDIPVYLTRIDGHAALVNDACLALADSLPENMTGGLVVRENGKPTGLLIDNAEGLIQLPDLATSDLNRLLLQAEQNCLEKGLTMLVDAGLSYSELKELESIYNSGTLSIPVYAMVAGDDAEQLIEQGQISTEKFQVAAIKVYADGALGSRGALLSNVYHDDTINQGLQLISYDELVHLCKKAKENNLQVNVHAIGDSANRMVLQAFSSVLEPGNDRRWRIEHAQVITPNDSSFWGEYNIIPSIQPTHATSDMYWADERLGYPRVKNAYAYNRLKRWANGQIALGTDFPVEDIDPLKTFFAATIRKDEDYFPERGFQIDDRLTRHEAIYGMTLGAAYSIFKENETGSIKTGKRGDIIVLDKNLLECDENEILSTKVLNTMVHGKILYSAIQQ